MGVWHSAEVKLTKCQFKREEGSAGATTITKNLIKIWVCGAVVAQLTLNQLVVGSTPTTPTKDSNSASYSHFIIKFIPHSADFRQF